MSRFDDIAVNMGFEDLEDLKQNSEPNCDDLFDAELPLWQTTPYTKNEIEQVQNYLKCDYKTLKKICRDASILHISLTAYSIKMERLKELKEFASNVSGVPVEQAIENMKKFGKRLQDSKNIHIFDTSQTKESQMESWHTNLPEENKENIAKAIIERLEGQGWELHEYSSLKSILECGAICVGKEGYLMGSLEGHPQNIIQWDEVLRLGVPKPVEIKAYRITNPNDEDVFKAIQKRFFAGGVGWANSFFKLKENPACPVYFRPESNTLLSDLVSPISEIKEISWCKFLENGIPGVLPTKEEYEAGKEKAKWEGMKGKLCWFWDFDDECSVLSFFLTTDGKKFKSSNRDMRNGGLWNHCKVMTKEEALSMIWEASND